MASKIRGVVASSNTNVVICKFFIWDDHQCKWFFSVTDDGFFELNLIYSIHFKSTEKARLIIGGSFNGLEILESEHFPIILTTSQGKECTFLEMRGREISLGSQIELKWLRRKYELILKTSWYWRAFNRVFKNIKYSLLCQWLSQ